MRKAGAFIHPEPDFREPALRNFDHVLSTYSKGTEQQVGQCLNGMAPISSQPAHQSAGLIRCSYRWAESFPVRDESLMESFSADRMHP